MGLTSGIHEFCFSQSIDNCHDESLWSASSTSTYMDTISMNQQRNTGDNNYRWFNDFYGSGSSCFAFGNNTYGKSKRCFHSGGALSKMRQNVIIYKLQPPAFGNVRNPRKDVMIYKYYHPMRGTITINLRNKNDRPAFEDNHYNLLENSIGNLLPIVYDDIDGSMIKLGDNLSCSETNSTNTELTGEASLQKCQSICAKNIDCVAITWYEDKRFGTRCDIHFECSEKTTVSYPGMASLYGKTSIVHTIITDTTLSTPENWETVWTLVSNANDERCINWCIAQKPNVLLDFESSPAYSISIKLLDSSNVEAFGTVTIQLVNENEPPTIIDVIERYVHENVVVGTSIPPAIEVYDEDVGDQIECVVVDGNIIENSKIAFKWVDGIAADQYTPHCILAVNDASIFDFENSQHVFTVFLKVRDITTRSPDSMESAVGSITITMVDVNEPPIFNANMMLVHTDIELISSNYDIQANKLDVNDFLNGDLFVLEILSTLTSDNDQLSHVPLKFQHDVSDQNSVGFSVGNGHGSTALQIRMANGTNLAVNNFQHQKVSVNEKTRRTIIVEKVAGGRKIQVFINGVESISGSQIAQINGDIYNNGSILFGDVSGWRFEGILHQIILSRNRMYLPSCISSCGKSSTHEMEINEGDMLYKFIDLYTFVKDHDLSDVTDSLVFSLSSVYPTSGNSIFSLSSTTQYIHVAGHSNFEAESQYTLTVLVTDSGGLSNGLSITVSILDLNDASTPRNKLSPWSMFYAPENVFSRSLHQYSF